MGYGTQLVPISPGITSSDVEYHGFLLALHQLHHLLNLHNSYTKSMEISWTCNVQRVQIQQWDGEIIIRGDCKTIIDQMKGRSTPRKQRHHYIKALDIIQHICHLDMNLNHVDDDYGCTQAPRCVHFIYEHVMRDKNSFCDLLCTQALYELQRNLFDEILESINYVSKDPFVCNYQTMDLSASQNTARKYHTPTPHSTLLQRISELDEVHLPISWRPALLLSIALSAIRFKDPMTLYSTGQLLVDTVTKLHPSSLGIEGEDLISQWLDVGTTMRYVRTTNETKRFRTVSSVLVRNDVWDISWTQLIENLHLRSMSIVSLASVALSND